VKFGVKYGRALSDFDPQRTRSVQSSSNSIQNCDSKIDDRQTDASDLIICPMLCYSNGTDNNKRIRTRHDTVTRRTVQAVQTKIDENAEDRPDSKGI